MKGNTAASDLTKKFETYSSAAQDTSSQNSASEGIRGAAEWIKKIAGEATNILKNARNKIPKIPPIFLLCRIMYLPGMSAIALAGQIINELQRHGFITEVNFDGTKNCVVEFVEIVAEKIIEEIKDNAKVTSVITTPAGPIAIEGKVD